jgi:hypothetical protein
VDTVALVAQDSCSGVSGVHHLALGWATTSAYNTDCLRLSIEYVFRDSLLLFVLTIPPKLLDDTPT